MQRRRKKRMILRAALLCSRRNKKTLAWAWVKKSKQRAEKHVFGSFLFLFFFSQMFLPKNQMQKRKRQASFASGICIRRRACPALFFHTSPFYIQLASCVALFTFLLANFRERESIKRSFFFLVEVAFHAGKYMH